MSWSFPQITSLHYTLCASVYDDLSPHHCINGLLQLLFQLCDLPGHTNDMSMTSAYCAQSLDPGDFPGVVIRHTWNFLHKVWCKPGWPKNS